MAAPVQAQWLFGNFGDPHPVEMQPGVSQRDIHHIAAAYGLRLLTPPYRNGNVYVVDGIDRGGNQDRLIIDGRDGTVLQRFRVEQAGVSPPDRNAVSPPPDYEPPQRRGLFGFLQDGSPPVPSENVPGEHLRPLQGRPLTTPPALASANPDAGQSTDLPPAPGFERPKVKPKHQVRVKHPDDAPVTSVKADPQPTQPELDTPSNTPPAKAPTAAPAPKNLAVSQTALPPPAAAVAPRPPAPARKVVVPPKANAPLNDIPPAPLD